MNDETFYKKLDNERKIMNNLIHYRSLCILFDNVTVEDSPQIIQRIRKINKKVDFYKNKPDLIMQIIKGNSDIELRKCFTPVYYNLYSLIMGY